MSVPVSLAVEGGAESLREVEREPLERYARSYRAVSCTSAADALAELESLAMAGEQVALVIAAQWMAGMTGRELLGKARGFFPQGQRGLLIDWMTWGDGRTGEAIFKAMARRQIDY